MDKQVLLSSQGTVSTSQYTVGLLKDGKHTNLIIIIFGYSTPCVSLGIPCVSLGTPCVYLGTPCVSLGMPYVSLGKPSVHIFEYTLCIFGYTLCIFGYPLCIFGYTLCIFGYTLCIFGYIHPLSLDTFLSVAMYLSSGHTFSCHQAGLKIALYSQSRLSLKDLFRKD